MRLVTPSIPADAPYLDKLMVEAIERTFPTSEQLGGAKVAWSRAAKRWMKQKI